MAVIRKFGHSSVDDGGEGNIFWVTMADLLLGLAIIFMTLFVLAMTGFTQQSLEQKKTQAEISQELTQKLKEAKIEAEVDPTTGNIKISDLELFDIGSYTLSPKGKSLLDKLMPIYINTIFAKKDLVEKIDNIIIQGHTDSQSFVGATKEQSFVRNMDLSTKRANSVAEYMFHTAYNKAYSDNLMKKVVVEGKSFTEPIMVNGKEDYNKSRRVELKLKAKDSELAKVLYSGEGAKE